KAASGVSIKNRPSIIAPEMPMTGLPVDIPDALVKDKVTPADWAMATLASAYWVEFETSGDPNGGSRPKWPQHEPFVHRVIDFTNH
ncbi:hypothetical protein ACC677_37435, partial [Rhizobium ruizarguesonis]